MKPSTLLLTAVALLFGVQSAVGDFVEIDNLSNPSNSSVVTASAGGITVTRTITNPTGVQFTHSGSQFGVVDNPSAFAPPVIGTFTYTAAGGTFQDLLRATSSAVDPFAEGLTFNYTVFNFNDLNPPNYSVRIFADNVEQHYEVLAVGNHEFEYRPAEDVGTFDVNEIKLVFERNTAAGGGFFAIQNSVTVTPEPASALLFGSLAMCFAARRRR